MTSKYSSSIKVRLSRLFNYIVLIAFIFMLLMVSLVFIYFENYLIESTIDELTFQQKASIKTT